MRTDPRTLLPRLERLYTAVVSDCLDQLGARSQVMQPAIRPLYPEARMVGLAATILAHEVYAVPAEPYLRQLEAIDCLRPDEVIVVSKVDGCFFGELLATSSRARGARGIVLDAYTRDCQRLIEMRFPTFARGITPTDSLGRLDAAGIHVPVACGGVLVNPGDLVFGDCDGVVVIPQDLAAEVITLAEEKARVEDSIRRILASGESLVATFQRHGVI